MLAPLTLTSFGKGEALHQLLFGSLIIRQRKFQEERMTQYRNLGGFYSSTSLTHKSGRFSRLAKAAVAVSLLAAPMSAAHAQSSGEIVGQTSNIADKVKDINDTIETLTGENTTKALQGLKRLAGAISDVAPYLGFLSAVMELSTIGQPSDLDIILKEFEKTNGKIDNLSAKLDTATMTIINKVDVANQKESVEGYRILIEGARRELETFRKMGSNPNTSNVKNVQGNLFTNTSVAASRKCTAGLLEQVAAANFGDIREIAGIGHYMLDAMNEARLLSGSYHVLNTTLNNDRNLSSDEIEAEARVVMKDHDTLINGCTQALSLVLNKYSKPGQRMDSALAYLKDNLETLKTADSLVKTLDARYPYHNWVAVKYDGVRGFDNHYAIGGGNVRLILPEGTRDWNVLLTFYDKDAEFDNQGFKVGDCQYAFSRLERGLITTDQPSRYGTNSGWPSGDLSQVYTAFKNWCGKPALAGTWLARNYNGAPDFAASDPSSVTTEIFPVNNPSSNPAVYYNFSNYGNYLVMLNPMTGAKSTFAAQRAATANQAAADARQAAPNAAPPGSLAWIVAQNNIAAYSAEIDFCHSSLQDTATANNITVEFMSGNAAVGSQVISGSASDCGVFSKGYLTATATVVGKNVDGIRVSTDGNDGMYIDQVKAYKNGSLFIWEGRDNGGGWCLSTDVNDYTGGWEAVTSGVCAKTQYFNNRAN